MDKIINSYSEHFLDKAFNYIKDNAIVYDEIYRHSKSLKSSLNSEILITSYNQMKEENKNFILIIEVGESNWFSYDNQIKIHELCEQTGVSEDKIVYITNDVMCDVVYDKWFTNQTKYKTKINFINYPCLLVGNKKDSKILEIILFLNNQILLCNNALINLNHLQRIQNPLNL